MASWFDPRDASRCCNNVCAVAARRRVDNIALAAACVQPLTCSVVKLMLLYSMPRAHRQGLANPRQSHVALCTSSSLLQSVSWLPCNRCALPFLSVGNERLPWRQVARNVAWRKHASGQRPQRLVATGVGCPCRFVVQCTVVGACSLHLLRGKHPVQQNGVRRCFAFCHGVCSPHLMYVPRRNWRSSSSGALVSAG